MPLLSYTTRRDSSGSDCSGYSDRSRSTAPTDFSDRPALKHHLTDIQSYRAEKQWDSFHSPGSSVETYASTVDSFEDLDDADYPLYDEPESEYDAYVPAALPSSPADFADFFPSPRRMCIRHDDTPDGNMNLRIDTEAQTASGRPVDLTLFHLRMHDLKSRNFSLRRYCRDSGREVCHSNRKYTTRSSDRRPALQRSMSSALASLGFRSDNRSFTAVSLKRADSGYGSGSDTDDDGDGDPASAKASHTGRIPLPTNTTNLQFSNYAHVDVKRRGAKSSKRYEFEYWGSTYAWRRVAKKTADSREMSYHLYNTETSLPVAHIVPVPMTPAEREEESSKGGWIPPSSMWISDEKIISGFSDVAE
jgi:hypothetical protein